MTFQSLGLIFFFISSWNFKMDWPWPHPTWQSHLFPLSPKHTNTHTHTLWVKLTITTMLALSVSPCFDN